MTAKLLGPAPSSAQDGASKAYVDLGEYGTSRASRWNAYGMTCSPLEAPNTMSSSMAPGTIHLGRFTLERDMPSALRTVRFWRAAAAVSSTGGFVAVLDTSGVIKGSVSSDVGSAWSTGSGDTSATVGTWGGNKGDDFIIAILQIGGTGMKLSRADNGAAHNIGLTGANLLWATNGTSQTSITNRTLSSNAAFGEAFMAMLQ